MQMTGAWVVRGVVPWVGPLTLDSRWGGALPVWDPAQPGALLSQVSAWHSLSPFPSATTGCIPPSLNKQTNEQTN